MSEIIISRTKDHQTGEIVWIVMGGGDTEDYNRGFTEMRIHEDPDNADMYIEGEGHIRAFFEAVIKRRVTPSIIEWDAEP